jgi:uncharacterized protein (TIGR01244 family)
VAAAVVGWAPASPRVEKIEAPGIENFSRIEGEPGFAGSPVGLGGATEPSAMPWLRGQGFASVINLRFATEEGVDVEGSRAAAEAAGLDYIHLPFNPKVPDPELVGEFLAAVGSQENQPVYIHCGSATRAAALWMIARVLRDGWELEAAGEEAKGIAGKPDAAIAFATAYLSERRNP